MVSFNNVAFAWFNTLIFRDDFNGFFFFFRNIASMMFITYIFIFSNEKTGSPGRQGDSIFLMYGNIG